MRVVMMMCLVLACTALIGASGAVAQELKPGDAAPDFSLPGSDGKTYSLADFKGKRAVVVAWFPKAFTGGCTAECKSMKETGPALRQFDVAYFTASVDPPETNKQFAESLELDFPILSDPARTVAKAYGVVPDDARGARAMDFLHRYRRQDSLYRQAGENGHTRPGHGSTAEGAGDSNLALKGWRGCCDALSGRRWRRGGRVRTQEEPERSAVRGLVVVIAGDELRDCVRQLLEERRPVAS